MENQQEITQVQKEENEGAALSEISQIQKEKNEEEATIAEAKALMQIWPPYMPSLSQNIGSLVEIFGLGPLSDTTATLLYNFDKEAFVSVHNGAQEKFAGLSAGGYFYMSDRPDEFHGVQTPYKRLDRMHDLVISHLGDLAFGEMNDCTVLYGELCVDPFKFGRIYTVMKEVDTEDHAIALSIVSPNFFSIDQSYAGKKYPKGTKIAIKQPHLVKAEDGFIWLHVDNPWSIVTVDEFPEDKTTGFLDWLENGKRAYDAQAWEPCVRNYTKCKIFISHEAARGLFKNDAKRKSLFFDLHSKRAQAYIELGRHSKALQDANVCGTIYITYPPNLIMEGVRPKIESLLSLGRYKEAYWLLNNLVIDDNPKTKKSLIDFYQQKCVEYYRVGEAIAGIAGCKNYCKPDADYIGPVEIKNTANGHGKGLFATEFVKAGTVLLICRALARCDNYSYPFMHVPMANGLFRNLVNALEHGGNDVLTLFLSLSASNKSPSIPKLLELVMDDSKRATISPETAHQEYAKLGIKGILHVLKKIAFDDMSPENRNNSMIPAEKRSYYGIWLIPSFINHSCLPNASRINVGDIMSIHASKDINEGEEITIPYFDVLLPYPVRQAACRAWGFSCLCERCEIEKNVVSLDGIYEKFHSIYSDSDESRIDIEAMGRLCDELDVYLEGVLKNEHSILIRSSFTLPYLARLCLNSEEYDRLQYDENACRTYLKNLRILLEAMAATCPGDSRHVTLAWRNLETYKKIVTIYPEYDGCYERMYKLDRACTSVYGCQKRKIVKAILSKTSEKSIFCNRL